jgi:hypothetical protein
MGRRLFPSLIYGRAVCNFMQARREAESSDLPTHKFHLPIDIVKLMAYEREGIFLVLKMNIFHAHNSGFMTSQLSCKKGVRQVPEANSCVQMSL